MIRKKHELKVECDLRSDKDVDRLDDKKETRAVVSIFGNYFKF